MSQRELSRLEVIQRVCRTTLTQRRAAELLRLSVRQVKRLARAYRRGGTAALISKRRGHPSNRRLPAEVVTEARKLLPERYHDFGPTLAREKLAECHGLRLGVETVRQLIIADGLWQVRRAHRPVIHQLRERRARLGELVQLDGSPHDWFEGRAPKSTLPVFVDDATGRLMELRFAAAETTFAYFAAVESYLVRHGKPLALRPAYTLRGARVEVREAGDGTLRVGYQGQALAFNLYRAPEREPAPVTPTKLINATLDQSAPPAGKRPRRPYHPPPTHPWRLDRFGKGTPLKEPPG